MALCQRSVVAVVVLGSLASVACGASNERSPSAPQSMASRAYGGAVREEMAPQAYPTTPMGTMAAQPMAPPPPPAQPGIAQSAPEPTGTEHYQDYGVNPFVETKKDRLSTFSIDVDTASYSISRRKLNENTLPPFAAVRAEEFLNSFDYAYESPTAGAPFHVDFAAAPSPFEKGHHLIRVGVQTKRIPQSERMPVHLVYLVDVSGSMNAPDRLPWAKKSLKLLTETLHPGDTVALCTYAGHVAKVLDPTGIDRKADILRAIDNLEAGGSTGMNSGIQLAYDLASKTMQKGHVNRVVVLSDGDANVGPSSHEDILKTIASYKDKGITLSTVGFGSGNYKDVMMEQLADKGDGNYTYIDTEDHARKVFGEEVDGLLQVVARDVKIQVELDPNVVRRYRLVGYENRDIADKDFRNDKVDAGEVGSGHSVTAIYDVEMISTTSSPMTVRLRYKPARNALNGGSDQATEIAQPMPVSAISKSFEASPENFRFATAVMGFADVLRHAPSAPASQLPDIERIAAGSTGNRAERIELVGLVRRAEILSGVTPSGTALAK